MYVCQRLPLIHLDNCGATVLTWFDTDAFLPYTCSCLRRMARGEPVLDPSTGRTSMLAAEYAAVLDHLQGEKDRLAAATAAAAVGTGAEAAAGASSGSSFVGQPVQQQQQQPLRDGGGSGGIEADTLSGNSSKQPVLSAQAPHRPLGVEPAPQRRIAPVSRDSTAADGLQRDAARYSSTAAAADGPAGCQLCSQKADAAQARASSGRGSGGSDTGVGPSSPGRPPVEQAQDPATRCVGKGAWMQLTG